MSSFHRDQPPEDSHGPAFFQDTDPGPVGAGRQWIHSETGVIRTRNLDDDGWVLSGRQAEAQADSAAGDTAALVADFNALLAKLRAVGVLEET